MEISSISGLTELEMEGSRLIEQWPMNSIDDLNLQAIVAAFGDNIHNHQTFNPKTSIDTSFSPSTINVRPTKQFKPNAFNLPSQNFYSNFTPNDVFSLVNSTNPNQMGHFLKPKQEAFSDNNLFVSKNNSQMGDQDYVLKSCEGAKRMATNTNRVSHSQDHIIAERKRREKLSQRFIALSSIVPGLKKMDKASVLGDAIKYLKQLQERVRTLEEETNKKGIESVVIVKKSHFIVGEDENYISSSLDENFPKGPFFKPLPEIEARICDKNVLIRIHCQKRKGIVEKIVGEIEKLKLSVINSSVLTFGCSALDLTIVAQMDNEFTMSAKDIAMNLHSAFKFI